MTDEFEVILDRCVADLVAGRATIQSCLRRYPVYADQLGALLKVVERTQTISLPAPLADDKRRVLETRLLRRAGQLRPAPVPQPSLARRPVWRRGFTLALASLIVVFLLFGSVVGASAASVPGDVLYTVKRATEQVRLTLASEPQKVDLYLEFAQRRFQELRILTGRGEVSKDLLVQMSGDTSLVLEQVPALPPQEQQAVLTSLKTFQDQQLQVLEDLASSVQGDTQAAVMAALADSTAKRKQAVELLAGAAPESGPAGNSAGAPSPTLPLPETESSHGNPSAKPDSTDKAGPQGPKATKVPPAVAPQQKPTPRAEHTPPGQSKQSSSQVPPGQAKQLMHQAASEKPTKAPSK